MRPRTDKKECGQARLLPHLGYFFVSADSFVDRQNHPIFIFICQAGNPINIVQPPTVLVDHARDLMFIIK